MKTVKLTIEYDGTHYVGWQFQLNGSSVQEVVEAALEKIHGCRTSVVSSGRTDSGVHARGMVAHFKTDNDLPMSAYLEGMNRNLPPDVAIVDAVEVLPDFHARFSALGKKYRYSIRQGMVRSPISDRYSWHLKRALDLDTMNQAASCLVGKHDFAAFRSSGCNAKTTVREIYSARFKRHGQLLHFDIIGGGFLRNMVRVIVGTLVEVGCGTRSSDDIKRLINSGVRDLSGVTAPAHGLCLMQVWYDGSPDDWITGSKRCHSCQKSLDKEQ